jgi:hypothetical protein
MTEKYMKQIEEITKNISENWLANDGGLTAAACDLLAVAGWVKLDLKMVPTMDREKLLVCRNDAYEREFNSGTGSESELYEILRTACNEELDKPERSWSF